MADTASNPADGPSDSKARDLLQAIYEQLRQLAAARLAQERAGQTLDPTALVHEAYVRLTNGDPRFRNKAHFFAVAATTIRRILIERAREKATLKRGGDGSGGPAQRITLDTVMLGTTDSPLDLLQFDGVLDRLGTLDDRKQRVVEMKVFAGMSSAQVALALDIGETTVERDWSFAKAWLIKELRAQPEALP